jgi:hypothetical protein
MPIDFVCSGCANQLRVSDESAGKDARCPKCGAINRVPGVTAGPFSSPGVPPATPEKKDYRVGEAGSPTASNPFGAASVNPYAPPQAASYQPGYGQYPAVPIQPTVVGVEPILNYAWQVWQQNLGLLVGAYATILGIALAIGIPLGIVQAALEANNNPEASALLGAVVNLGANVVQIFLGIGMAQICLKLARRQPAEFTDLFNGGSRFLPVLGVSVLLGIAIGLGMLLCIVPGILLALMWWPAYYLVVDDKAPVIESFSRASEITKGNWGTAFLVFLLAWVIGLVGILALCIGIIFAAPLVLMLWTTAYLMMSGQLPAYPQQAQYPAYGKP